MASLTKLTRQEEQEWRNRVDDLYRVALTAKRTANAEEQKLRKYMRDQWYGTSPPLICQENNDGPRVMEEE